MTADLTLTDLHRYPGMLRRGSVVVRPVPEPGRGICRGVVVDMERGASHAVIAWEANAWEDARLDWLMVGDLALDLTDPTSRWHLEQWARRQPRCFEIATQAALEAMGRARRGSDFTDDQIRTLKALCERLAEER